MNTSQVHLQKIYQDFAKVPVLVQALKKDTDIKEQKTMPASHKEPQETVTQRPQQDTGRQFERLYSMCSYYLWTCSQDNTREERTGVSPTVNSRHVGEDGTFADQRSTGICSPSSGN